MKNSKTKTKRPMHLELPLRPEAKMFVGVDPGRSGAIAIYKPSGPAGWFSLAKPLVEIDKWIRANGIDQSVPVWIERVGAMPGQGVTSSFSFGQADGSIRGILAANGITPSEVAPLKWQNDLVCRTGGDKAVSRAYARKRWPWATFTNRTADAFLLAWYCYLRETEAMMPKDAD